MTIESSESVDRSNEGTEVESPKLSLGFLIECSKSKNGNVKCNKKPHNYAAKAVGKELDGKLAYHQESETWATWAGTHWQRVTNPMKAKRLIAEVVERGTDPDGYTNHYLNAIVEQLTIANILPMPELVSNVVPFKNGLLDIESGKLKEAEPNYATDYVLPHDYDSEAECPTIEAWLKESVDNDEDTVDLLLAWLSALVRGLFRQHFLILIGPGGTSKGTFQRLGVALVGEYNTEVSTLKNLEGNRFELAKHQGKRLCLINEAGKFGAHLANLKAMTGDDPLPLERKNKQQQGTFRYTGQVWLATNDEISSSDSGLERRRITVRFDRRVSAEKKQKWHRLGGEEAILHSEIPGLTRLLIEKFPPSAIDAALANLPDRVTEANVLGMCAGSSVAEWLLCSCEFDENAKTQIGQQGQNAKTLLYPSYRAWCEGNGRNHPVASNNFKSELFEVAENLGHDLSEDKDTKTRCVHIVGLKLILS